MICETLKADGASTRRQREWASGAVLRRPRVRSISEEWVGKKVLMKRRPDQKKRANNYSTCFGAHQRHRERVLVLLLGEPRVKVRAFAKVRDLGRALRRQKNVVRLEVAMDQWLIEIMVKVAHSF